LGGGTAPAALTHFFRPLPHGQLVAAAYQYRAILFHAERAQIPLVDNASHFAETGLQGHTEGLDPFDFQIEAIRAWEAGGRRGTVVLPTGAGKSYMTRLLIASLAMKDSRCSTLIIVPTRVLLYQWHAQLRRAFDQPVGIVGDDLLDLQPITVTTYASARINMSWFGDR
jgi:superfamily II DNA or RNA helicase